jgi:hypothetical protein
MQMYPGLSTGYFNIEFSEIQDRVTLSIFNVNGSCIKKRQITDVIEIREDLFTRPDGIYFIQVITSGQSKTFPFIKSS